MAQPHADSRAHLVQRRSARRQPGAGRAHERIAKTRALRCAGRMRLQGDRGRLSIRLEHRVRLQPQPHRRRSHSGRCDHPVPRPGRAKTIEKTVQSLIGAKRVIIHLYNSTSPAQLASSSASRRTRSCRSPCRRALDSGATAGGGHRGNAAYSPEVSARRRSEFAKEISEAVMDV